MDFLSHSLVALTGLLGLVSLYLWRTKAWTTHKTKGKLVPEPSGALPIIGHLHQLSSQKPIFRTFAEIADKYGPIFIFRLGVHPVVVVCSYEAVKECFTINDKVLASRPRSAHGTHLGYDYAAFGFASYGPLWRSMRKLVMSELLSGRRLETLKHVQNSEVETLVRDLYGVWEMKRCRSTKVVISEWIEHFTLNIITEMIAGKRYFDGGIMIDGEAQRIGRLIKEYMLISGAPVISDMIPVPKWIDLLFWRLKSMKRIGREIDVLIGNWVEEHIERKNSTEPISNKQDFIDIMLSVLEETSELGYTRETLIKGTISNLIIAGSETTAINLTWVLALLLNNRKSLKRAQEELDLIVGRERWVEDSDIKHLVYLQAIVKETLRLYPPGPLAVPHEASEDCTIGGYRIQKGTRVFVNLWKLHRDPTFWTHPESFSPERFLDSQIDASGHHFEFIPFGSGRRSCPGMTFALQLTHVTLARLLQGFELERPSDSPVDMTEGLGVTLPRATSLEVILSPRLPTELYRQ